MWLPVVGYGGYYISNMGRVLSVKRKAKRLLKQQTDKDGYKIVGLTVAGKTTLLKVHRLVALAFVVNHECCPCVNHKDENKNNNRADNLEWCTTQYNNNYGTRLNRITEKERKPMLQYDSDGVCVGRFASMTEASKKTGISKANISSCARGRRKRAGGYKWAYEGDRSTE